MSVMTTLRRLLEVVMSVMTTPRRLLEVVMSEMTTPKRLLEALMSVMATARADSNQLFGASSATQSRRICCSLLESEPVFGILLPWQMSVSVIFATR